MSLTGVMEYLDRHARLNKRWGATWFKVVVKGADRHFSATDVNSGAYIDSRDDGKYPKSLRM